MQPFLPIQNPHEPDLPDSAYGPCERTAVADNPNTSHNAAYAVPENNFAVE